MVKIRKVKIEDWDITKEEEKIQLQEILREDVEYKENDEEQEIEEIAEESKKQSEEMHGGTEITMTLQVKDSKTQEAQMEQGLTEEQEEERKNEHKEQEIKQEEQKEKEKEEGGKKEGEEEREQESEEEEEREKGEEGEEKREGKEEQDKEEREEEEEEGIQNYEAVEIKRRKKPTEAVEIKRRKKPTLALLKHTFYQTIDYIAEYKTKYEDFSGYDELSIREIIKRVMDKRALNKCYTTKIRETVYLILDNSGSMCWWAELLQQLSAIAERRKDVEIIIAPNGYCWDEQEAKKLEKLFKEQKKIIIYVGDFDGANTPIELSWKNRVYWICPEDRYYFFSSHNWVEYNENDFDGMFFRVFTENTLIKALKKMRTWKKGFYDFEEEHEYMDIEDPDIEDY